MATFEVTDPAVIAAIVGELSTVTPTNTLYVDRFRASLTGVEDGSWENPFLTIQAAADVVPEDTTGKSVAIIKIGQGTYTEDGLLNIDITNKRINLVSEGPWQLGTSSSPVNLEISGTVGSGGTLTSFNILVFEQASPGNGGEFSETIVPKIFGTLKYTFTGGTDLVRTALNIDIQGSPDAITAVSGSEVALSLDRCNIQGNIVGDGVDIQSAITTVFNSSVDIKSMRRALLCRMRGDWTVTAGPLTDRVAGFKSCFWEPGLSWTGPVLSLWMDADTNWTAKQPTKLALLGGATVQLVHDDVALTP